MSEREIKVGSTWRNVHGEATVKGIYEEDGITWVEIPVCDFDTAVGYFRATHEWVRDPVEAPAVGTWWKNKSGPPCTVEVFDTSKRMVSRGEQLISYRWGWGNSASELHVGGFLNSFEPCDPPPLHAAIKELCEHYGSTWGTGNHPWPTLEAMKEFIDAARTVAKLYEGGER